MDVLVIHSCWQNYAKDDIQNKMTFFICYKRLFSLGTGVRPGTLDIPVSLTRSFPNNKEACWALTLWWSVWGLFLPHSESSWNFLTQLEACCCGRIIMTLIPRTHSDQHFLSADRCPWGYKSSLSASSQCHILFTYYVWKSSHLLITWVLWTNIWTYLSLWAVTELEMCSCFRSLWV